MHLYSIGSPKANRWTGLLMDAFFERWEPRLEFTADPDSHDLRNVYVMVRQDGLPYTPPVGAFGSGSLERAHFQHARGGRCWPSGYAVTGPMLTL